MRKEIHLNLIEKTMIKRVLVMLKHSGEYDTLLSDGIPIYNTKFRNNAEDATEEPEQNYNTVTSAYQSIMTKIKMGGNLNFVSDYFAKLPKKKKTKLANENKTDHKFTCME